MLTAALAACGPPRITLVAPPDRAAELRAGPPLPINQVWLLERSGLSPMDTTVTVDASAGRVIVVRHPAPDNAVFAMISIPPDSTASDSVQVALRPTPGRYGIEITASPRIPPGSQLTFSYAVHFVAPTEGVTAYGSATRFELGLGVGRVQPDARLRFIAGDRPAADMLRVPVGENGLYQVAAPK